MRRSGANKIDMLNGPIWSKLPLFAFPVAATAILEQLFNASDLAVVGNFAGDKSTAAVAAVGANGPVIGLIVNFLIGISLGANVVIANAMGRNNKDSVQRAVQTSVIFALVGGTVVAVIAELFVGKMLSSLNVPEDVLPLAIIYFRIYLIGLPVILLYNFEAAIFRSVGDTKVPLIALARIRSSECCAQSLLCYSAQNDRQRCCDGDGYLQCGQLDYTFCAPCKVG